MRPSMVCGSDEATERQSDGERRRKCGTERAAQTEGPSGRGGRSGGTAVSADAPAPGSPGHARFERFTRYVIFHPKRPSEAPGSPRKCPASPRKPSKRPRNRAKPPRNAPEVAAEGTPGSKARGHGGTKWADTADRRPPEGVRTARNRRRNARPDRVGGGRGSPLRAHVPQALQSMRWRGASARVRCSRCSRW